MGDKAEKKLADLVLLGESIKSAVNGQLTESDYWGAIAYVTDEVATLKNADHEPEWAQSENTDLGLIDSMNLLLPRLRGLAAVLHASAQNDLSREEIATTSSSLVYLVDQTNRLVQEWWDARTKQNREDAS